MSRIFLSRKALDHARRCPVCLGNVQPETVFGSPETLVTRGVESAAIITARFATALERAVIGKTTERSISAALKGARFETDAFAGAVEDEVKMGLMLGALDAAYEAEEGVTIEPVAFVDKDKRWSSRPMADAIRAFLKRKVVTPQVFKEMNAAAKKHAFTVSGLASVAMIETVQSELAGQVASGADLRDFRKYVSRRLESAGWTPSSPSHVETIFRTNVLSAYNGGRHRQMTQPDVLALRPFWQVMTPNDGPPRQRPNHQKTHLAVFRADDPAFPGAIPPWDFNCRCRFRSLSARQAEGMTIRDGSFLTALSLPAPGFGGGGIEGLLTGPKVKRTRKKG